MADDPVAEIPARTTVASAIGPNAHDHAAARAGGGRARRRARPYYLIGFPFWVAAAIRAGSDTSGFDGSSARLGAGLLLAFAALLLSEHFVSSFLRWYPRPYFVLQTGLVLGLMFLLPDLDYFALLFVPLSAQAMLVCSWPVGYGWIAGFTVAMAAGLLATQDLATGASLVVLYAGAFLFVASYATVTQQAEAAREESQTLLADLREAYRRLEAYAARVQALTVVEERNRLARDLHDSVTQALYGLTLSAEAAARQLAAGDADAAEGQLREVRETAQQALQEMRLLIFELRPPVLEAQGLASALQARLAAVEERAGLATALAVVGDGRLPENVEAELDRVAQEALNNALKHARAHRIEVRLRQGERDVALEIADDGVGFDAGAAGPRGGLGLRGMAERAARLGGRLAVESRPGAGTRVTVEVPR